MTTIEPNWIAYGTPMNLMLNLSQIACVQNDKEGHAVVYLNSGKTVTATQSSVADFWKVLGGEVEPHYTKQDLLTRFKAGFETSGRFDEEKWRVDRYKTRDGELHLVIDNADKYTEVSDWGADMIEYYRGEILPQLGDLPIEVWLGDVKIKEAAK